MKYQGIEYDIKYDTDIPGIMDNILGQIPVAKEQLRNHQFQTTEELYYYVKDSFRYKRDSGGWEIVKAPSALEWFREGDCKSFAVYIAGACLASGLKTKLRLCYYSAEDKKEGVAHIYAICEGKVMDTVNGAYYGDEMPYYHKKDIVLR